MSLKETENFHESRFFGISQTVPKIYKQHEILLILTVYTTAGLFFTYREITWPELARLRKQYTVNADKDKESRRKKY